MPGCDQVLKVPLGLDGKIVVRKHQPNRKSVCWEDKAWKSPKDWKSDSCWICNVALAPKGAGEHHFICAGSVSSLRTAQEGTIPSHGVERCRSRSVVASTRLRSSDIEGENTKWMCLCSVFRDLWLSTEVPQIYQDKKSSLCWLQKQQYCPRT